MPNSSFNTLRPVSVNRARPPTDPPLSPSRTCQKALFIGLTDGLVSHPQFTSCGGNGADALDRLKQFDLSGAEQFQPAVLVSDLGMPNEDGYDLIGKVRSAGYRAKVLPAVALTAFAGKESEQRTLLAGFQMHVPKPVDSQYLRSAARSICFSIHSGLVSSKLPQAGFSWYWSGYRGFALSNSWS